MIVTTAAHLPPAVAIHLTFAIAALVLGPIALTVRKGSRLHRAMGYSWVASMIGAAISSLFLFERSLPNLFGYGPIHILVVVTFFGIGTGIWHIANHRVARHKRTMWLTYLGGCVTAGAFALMPGRLLGNLLWHQALGLV